LRCEWCEWASGWRGKAKVSNGASSEVRAEASDARMWGVVAAELMVRRRPEEKNGMGKWEELVCSANTPAQG